MPQPEQGLIVQSLLWVEGVNAYTTANECNLTGLGLHEGSVTGNDHLLQMFANQAWIGGHQSRSVAAQTSQ